jgi:hypothetical protein
MACSFFAVYFRPLVPVCDGRRGRLRTVRGLAAPAYVPLSAVAAVAADKHIGALYAAAGALHQPAGAQTPHCSLDQGQLE